MSEPGVEYNVVLIAVVCMWALGVYRDVICISTQLNLKFISSHTYLKEKDGTSVGKITIFLTLSCCRLNKDPSANQKLQLF